MQTMVRSIAHRGSFFLVTIVLAISSLLISPSYVLADTSSSLSTRNILKTWEELGQIQCLQPPSNIDLTTLSDKQLVLYGLPTHAIINASLSFWKARLASPHVRHRTCGTSPNPKKVTHHQFLSHPQSPTNCSVGLCPTPNWSGNLANSSRGTYREADIVFNVPTIDTSDGSARVSIWAGVGGDADSDVGGSNAVVVQAGVDVSVNVFGTQFNESWWEVYPGVAEQDLPLQFLSAGDTIYADASSNIGNSGANYFYIQNDSNGSTDYNDHYDYSHFSDSATGECIVEKVLNSSNGKLYPLARFWESGQPTNTVRLDSCRVLPKNASGLLPIGKLAHFYMEAYSGNTQLASVGPISSDGYSYSVTWHHS